MSRANIAGVLFRGTAILIAIAAAIDPAITSHRPAKPEVAVVAVDPQRDSALAGRVARDLAGAFTVITAPLSTAGATVLVGDRLPSSTTDLAQPVFAVLGARDGPTLTLESATAPAKGPFDGRIPIDAVAHITGARGRTLEVTLRAGDLIVDRITRTVAADDVRLPLSLAFLPTATGAAPLRVSASVTGSRTATTDLLVDVRDQRWPVLFFDPRPSWMSTFVRRAIERDRRFVVTSRVVTSRNVSTDGGEPPSDLDDLPGLSRFSAVIVGAPEALRQSDIDGLDRFLRRRGGGVVLLFDQRVAGPYDRLTGVTSWLTRSTARTVSIAAAPSDSAQLRATEIAWPSTLPAGAELVARTSSSSSGDSAAARPVVWRSSVGEGRLIVSGALDAWRYRDPSTSSFDHFWQTLVADAASEAPPPVSVQLSNAIVAPGEWTDVTVTLRDVAIRSPLMNASNASPARASVSATLVGPAESRDPRVTVRLWPAGDVGRFHGTLRAPTTPGTYHMIASADGSTAEAPLVVALDASHPSPDDHELLTAWVTTHGGRLFPSPATKELIAALRSALHPEPRPEPWHPMRSAWWILPFTLTLGAEWWLRRRRGLA